MRKPVTLCLLLAAAAGAQQFQAGVARLAITPCEPIWMAGYAARKHPSTGVAKDLWAKALAIQDARGGRVVIVTMDLLRVPRSISDVVAREARKRYGLERPQLLMNCSHNHSGPLLWENDAFTALAPAEYEKCRLYTVRLTNELVDLIGAALRDLAPATISHGTGEAGFAANRRVASPSGYQIGYNPKGPVDHRVPVLKIAGRDKTLRAVLFGYGCHNTTIGPATYEINGDYAGFAQEQLEREHPGAAALFLQLCAGDQDPYPRGGLEVAQRHGNELAAAVERVLESKLPGVRGPLGTAFQTVELAFAPHTREVFEKRLSETNSARVRNARAMLSAYDEGHPIRSLSYPVQAVRFDKHLTLVALGGEPVVDYALRARRELPDVILAGYSNSVKSYIPSKRVLAEGGYEADESMLYYGLPGPYTPGVEETIFEAIRRVVREAGRPLILPY